MTFIDRLPRSNTLEDAYWVSKLATDVPERLTPLEAMLYFNCHRHWFYLFQRRYGMPVHREGYGRKTYYLKSELDRWLVDMISDDNSKYHCAVRLVAEELVNRLLPT